MRLLPVLSLVLVLVSAGAVAAPLLDTVGPPDALNPFAAAALSEGADAAYANPALLPWASDAVAVGVHVLVSRWTIDLDPRPASADVTEAIYDARRRLPDGTVARLDDRPLPTASLPRARGSESPNATGTYLSMGAARTFLDHRLAIGFYAVLPLTYVQRQRPFYVDEREQFFSNSLHVELQGDRLESSSFVVAAAGRPLPWLSLGLGLSIDNRSDVSNVLYMPDATDQDATLANTAVRVRTQVSPHAGLVIEPLAGWRLMATVHVPAQSNVDTHSELRFWNYPYPDGQDALVDDYRTVERAEPLRLALGSALAGSAAGLDWSAGLVGRWTRWSSYVDRHGQRPPDAWSDTFSVAAGGRMAWGGQRVGLDGTFVPSPVPAQRGRTNYVDNSRLGLAAAWDWRVPLDGLGLSVGLRGQGQRWLPRHQDKSADAAHPVIDEFPDSIDLFTGQPIAASAGLQSNNPGFPGFGSAGWLWTVGAVVRLDM